MVQPGNLGTDLACGPGITANNLCRLRKSCGRAVEKLWKILTAQIFKSFVFSGLRGVSPVEIKVFPKLASFSSMSDRGCGSRSKVPAEPNCSMTGTDPVMAGPQHNLICVKSGGNDSGSVISASPMYASKSDLNDLYSTSKNIGFKVDYHGSC